MKLKERITALEVVNFLFTKITISAILKDTTLLH